MKRTIARIIWWTTRIVGWSILAITFTAFFSFLTDDFKVALCIVAGVPAVFGVSILIARLDMWVERNK